MHGCMGVCCLPTGVWSCLSLSLVHPQVAQPLLPYALSFAAGAMIYVVLDDIIPETYTRYVRQKSKTYVLLSYAHVYMVVDTSGDGHVVRVS